MVFGLLHVKLEAPSKLKTAENKMCKIVINTKKKVLHFQSRYEESTAPRQNFSSTPY